MTLNSRNLSELSESEINSLSWCNKCTKFYARVKTLATKKLHLNLHGGLFQKRILLSCQNSNHHFSISYNKKFEQISCVKCRLESKELHKDKLRREEELYRETLRNDQERMYAEAKLQMDRELLLNNLLRSNLANSSTSSCCTSSCLCWNCHNLRKNTN